MKLLRWAALPVVVAAIALSGCAGQRTQVQPLAPTPTPVASVSLAPHTVSTSSLVNGNRVQIDTQNPSLSHADCSALIDRYLAQAGRKGQVVVQKPGGQVWKGALLPYCVNNRDGKGTFFNDYYFK